MAIPIYKSSDGCGRVFMQPAPHLKFVTTMHIILTNTGRQPITVISLESLVTGDKSLDFWWVDPTSSDLEPHKNTPIYIQPGQAIAVGTYWAGGEHDTRFRVGTSDGKKSEISTTFSTEDFPPALKPAVAALPGACKLMKEFQPGM